MTTVYTAGRSARRIERYVDLRHVPVDGRNLALVVAADELLDAARRGTAVTPVRWRVARGGCGATPAGCRGSTASARPAPGRAHRADRRRRSRAGAGGAATASTSATSDRSATPPRSSPPAAAPAPRAPASVARQAPTRRAARAAVTVAEPRPSGPAARHAVAMSFAVERYAGGQTHLGPELAWSYGRDRGVFASMAVGARKGLVVEAVGGVVESSLWGGRLALGAGLPLLRGGLVLAVEAGARLGQLRLQGRASAGDVTARDAATWLCYADASATLRVRVAGPVQARLGAGWVFRCWRNGRWRALRQSPLHQALRCRGSSARWWSFDDAQSGPTPGCRHAGDRGASDDAGLHRQQRRPDPGHDPVPGDGARDRRRRRASATLAAADRADVDVKVDGAMALAIPRR